MSRSLGNFRALSGDEDQGAAKWPFGFSRPAAVMIAFLSFSQLLSVCQGERLPAFRNMLLVFEAVHIRRSENCFRSSSMKVVILGGVGRVQETGHPECYVADLDLATCDHDHPGRLLSGRLTIWELLVFWDGQEREMCRSIGVAWEGKLGQRLMRIRAWPAGWLFHR